jgi:hypothetical protein
MTIEEAWPATASVLLVACQVKFAQSADELLDWRKLNVRTANQSHK